MQQVLATVNINMGFSTNPSLIITRSTYVPRLISEFITHYDLPQTAYNVIMDAITIQLDKENINVDDLGKEVKMTPPTQRIRRQNKENVLMETKGKKETVSWDTLNAQKPFFPSGGQLYPQNQNKNHKISSVYRNSHKNGDQQNQLLKPLIKSKSPVRGRDLPHCETKRSKSPILNRTPQRERLAATNLIRMPNQNTNQSQILSQIFDILTKNQPKTIRVLSPQFISFTGIQPEALTILQDFFQIVEQHQFMNMDRLYFMSRMRQLNLTKKLISALILNQCDVK